MAFPSIRSSANTNGTTATASPVVNLPATIAAGDTLVVYFKNATAGAIGWPSAEWVELVDASPDASVGQIGIAYRKALGGEGGTTITLSSGNGKFCAIARAVRDAADPTIRPPELSTVAVGTTGEPNATTCTPTGGAKDYLWDTFFLMEGEQTGITAYPASHTLDQTGLANSGTAGAVTTNCTAAAAARQLNASSLDAGVWDVTGTLDDSSAWTIAFHPAEEIPRPLAPEFEIPWVPAPRPSAPLVALTLAVNLLQSTLAPIEPKPPTPVMWANPSARPLLITTISGYPADDAAIAFAQRDWPNPARVRPAALTWLQNLQQTTLAPAAEATPFRQDVWPVPGRSSFLAPPSAPNLLVSMLGAPLVSVEWPNPTRRPVAAATWTQNLLESTLTPAAPSPVVPLEWPLPQLGSNLALTWIQTRQAYHEDERILRQSDWPNPTRLPAREPWTWTQNLLETTLAPAPLAKPFAQNEWPLPGRGPTPRLTWTQERKTYQDAPIATDRFPWNVPRRAPALALTWSQNLLESTLTPAAPAPVVSVVWPLPLRTPRPALTIAVGLLGTPLAEPSPVRPIEWPNPRGREYPIALRTWLQERKPSAVDLKPFAQHEWPNPRPTPVAFDLRVWFRAALTDAGFTVLLLEIVEEQLRAAAAAEEALRAASPTDEALRASNATNETLEPW